MILSWRKETLIDISISFQVNPTHRCIQNSLWYILLTNSLQNGAGGKKKMMMDDNPVIPGPNPGSKH